VSPGPPLWRSFPWNPDAAENQPFSAVFVSPAQGLGRFDRPENPAGVVYLAETPDHAIGEWIARFRGRSITEAHLKRNGVRRGLVRLKALPEIWEGIADLCDPKELDRHGMTPDSLAMRDRTVTQGIAARLFERGQTGLRWWSAHFGDWHTVVLFRERLPVDGLDYGVPEAVDLATPALLRAADWLDVGLGG
jgi:hypothetical protein